MRAARDDVIRVITRARARFFREDLRKNFVICKVTKPTAIVELIIASAKEASADFSRLIQSRSVARSFGCRCVAAN